MNDMSVTALALPAQEISTDVLVEKYAKCGETTDRTRSVVVSPSALAFVELRSTP